MKYLVTTEGVTRELEVLARDDGRFDVRMHDGRLLTADLVPVGGESLFSLIVGCESFEICIVQSEEAFRVAVRGVDFAMRVESEQERNARLVDGQSKAAGPVVLRSVMPGRVVRVMLREGEAVDSGSSILILEAMKMENEIRSPIRGIVRKLYAGPGQTVGNGEMLAVIEPGD